MAWITNFLFSIQIMAWIRIYVTEAVGMSEQDHMDCYYLLSYLKVIFTAWYPHGICMLVCYAHRFIIKYHSFCYETIMFGRVTHARRRWKAGALSVYLTHSVLTTAVAHWDWMRIHICIHPPVFHWYESYLLWATCANGDIGLIFLIKPRLN